MVGSFNDLTNQNTKVSTLPLDEVKASPSVYSPNDGGYNSEENMRWSTRKQVTKNFVVGDTVEDVNTSLNANIFPDHISLGDGMFSIDGYAFKIAAAGNISYDKRLNKEAENVDITTQYAQRFVQDLSGYGSDVSKKLESNIEKFCFTRFKHESTGSADLWLKATNRLSSKAEKVVGYVRLVYSDSYYNALTIDQENYVQYGNNKIYIVDYTTYHDQVQDDNGNVSPDGIESLLTDTSIRLNPEFGDPFSMVPDAIQNTIYIYYPVFVKQTAKSTTKKRQMVIYFEDILSLMFTHNQSFEEYFATPTDNFGTMLESHSNFYPYTGSPFVDINKNNPITELGSVDCKKVTLPTNIYNYTKLYDRNWTRIRTAYGSDDFKQSFEFLDTPVLHNYGLFLVNQQDSEVQNQINAKDGGLIGNTLSYYCLKIPNTQTKADGNTGYDGQNTYVAFMASDGRLCPNGFFCLDSNGNETTDNKIIEGYLHYFKRKYTESIDNNYNESTIDRVSIYNLTDWMSGNGGENYKRDYYDKQLSWYINLCYSSVIENTWLANAEGQTDTDRIKASGCGNQLIGSSVEGLDFGEFDCKYNYVYRDESDGEDHTGIITYSFDDTSDYYKLSNAVIDATDENGIYIHYISDANDCMKYAYVPDVGGKAATLYDDPINFLRKCYTFETVAKLNIILTYLGNEDPDRVTVTINSLRVDDYLMPKCGKEYNSTLIDDNRGIHNKYLQAYFVTSDYSLINSLRLTYNTNTWYCNIPTTITIKKTSSDYLCGKVTENNRPVYGGVEFGNKLPCEVERNDLYLYNLNVSTENYCIDNISQPFTYVSMSQPAYVQRNAFLHTSKIYGDDGQSFEEVIRNLILDIGLEDLEERVRRLEITIYGDGTDDNPGIENIVKGNDDLEIVGNETEIDNLEDRVVAIEDELLNLLQDAGIIGPNAMYFIKKFGITNITGSGTTFDFGSESSNTANSTLVSPIGNNPLVRYICISKEITRLGDKLFYNCPNTYSINAGQAMKVNRIEVRNIPITLLNGSGNLKSSLPLLPDDAYIYPRCTKIIVELEDNHKVMYYDNGTGKIIKRATKEECGTIDYATGNIYISGYENISIYARVYYRYCTLAKSELFTENKMPDSIVSIGDQTFAQNVDRGYKGSGLPSVNFGASLQYIGYAAFWGNALKEVNIPDTIIDETGVGSYAFAHCEDLLKVTYKAKKLSDNVFSWCSSLNDFTLYNSCNKLGSKCFTYDKDLEIIKFIGTGSNWMNITKGNDWAGKITNTVESPSDTDVSVSGIEKVICYPSEADAQSDTGRTDVFEYYPYEKIGNTVIPSPYKTDNELHPTTLNGTPITTVGDNQTEYIKVSGTYTLIKTNDVDLIISYPGDNFEVEHSYNVAMSGDTVTTASGTILSDGDYNGNVYYYAGDYTDPETSITIDADEVLSVNTNDGEITIKADAQGKKARVCAALIIDGIVIRQCETIITVSN